MAKQFARQFYHSQLWKEVRDSVLKRDNYICVQCSAPAKEVHHKIKLTPKNINDIQISVNENNLISLCRDCHMAIHRPERRQAEVIKSGYEFDINGMPIKQAPHVYK